MNIFKGIPSPMGIDKKDAVVFEDASYCLVTAHNAGFVCYGIDDPWQELTDDFIDTYCDRYIRSYAELLKYDNE